MNPPHLPTLLRLKQLIILVSALVNASIAKLVFSYVYHYIGDFPRSLKLLIFKAVIGYPVTRKRFEFLKKLSTNWQSGYPKKYKI